MHRLFILINLLAACLSASGGDTPILTNGLQLAEARRSPGLMHRPFDVEATIAVPAVVTKRIFRAHVDGHLFTFGVDQSKPELCPTNAGDRVRLRGEAYEDEIGALALNCLDVVRLGTGSVKVPISLTARQFLEEDHPDDLVRLSGTIRSVTPDETNPDYCFLALQCDGEIIYIALCIADADPAHLARLNGAEVSAVGRSFLPLEHDPRSLMGRHLDIFHASDIRILSSCPSVDFSRPLITDLRVNRPSDLLSLGRHRAVGTVLAVWGGNAALLKTDSAKLIRLEFQEGVLPVCGSRIEVAGFPGTDFARLSLSGAAWRSVSGAPSAEEKIRPVNEASIFLNDEGRPGFHTKLHGQTVRLTGTAHARPTVGQLTLAVGDHTVLVDASALPRALDEIEKGSTVEIVGVCIMDAENWRPDFSFPRIQTVVIVPRTSTDVTIVSRPSWWTPLKLFCVIGTLLLALCGIGFWNRSLRRLAARRSRELANEAIARAESDLKVYERTRLATELHDSLAQILTGVAFELETTERFAETNPSVMRKHLGIALKSLQACRDGLRNCLWDLRNHALEIPDMNQAIRRTLEQHLGDTALTIRFNVTRERLSDSTAHEILCIIRELVLNAIRHGKASEVKVAGAIEENVLRFSVADDGCGFDPANCPGMREGHYGLQGVRERVAGLEGEFSIQPRKPHGMKAVIAINISHPKAPEK